MLKINDEEIKQFESDLKTFASRAYPFATKFTVNTAAKETMVEARENVGRQMITRNKFTKQSILFNPTRTLNVSRQAATVGSIASYMEDQEFGGIKSKGGKQGVPIATTSASGEGEGVQPRRRLVRQKSPNNLANIRLSRKKPKARSRKQENFLRIKNAVKTGRKFIFLDLQKHPGIYKVTGGKRNPDIKLMHDMSKKSVNIPRNPWLAPAVRTVEERVPQIYKEALIFQLKRNNLFKG